MNTKLTKTAAVLAFIIGAMAIFAGGQVLLGKTMDYYVIDWLPIYNFIVGIDICLLYCRSLSGKAAKSPCQPRSATLTSHSIVMVILQTVYRDVVAPDSIIAMTVRIIVWLIILVLMFIQKQKGEKA